MSVRILIGDCRERLKELPDASVDSVVCDPPYHLTSIVKRFGSPNAAPAKVGKTGAFARASKGFMGQTWDGGDVAFQPETWAEVLRVLKPGGHLVAFSGTRTYHRMVVAIEDAGFEIRDQLAWVYGSGFPKSHDVAQGVEKRLTTGKDRRECRELGLDRNRFSGSVEGALIADTGGKVELTTPEAKAVEGWGTALKPSWEPICLARKPLIGSVATNVLTHGTGALNIDGCRIGTDGGTKAGVRAKKANGNVARWEEGNKGARNTIATIDAGRWPANLCHDGSDEVLAGFPETTSGTFSGHRNEPKTKGVYGKFDLQDERGHVGDSGSAARFFYCAKATTEERGEGNNHPTVKPKSLMRWLVRLVTPPGGTVLDPFTGSGSTGLACDAEQFDFIGIEMSPEYAAIAERRIRDAAGMFAQVEAA